jgi:hypothetical protein
MCMRPSLKNMYFNDAEFTDQLDQAQMEKVLKYVKSMLEKPVSETAYERFKRDAMKEIRQALEKR